MCVIQSFSKKTAALFEMDSLFFKHKYYYINRIYI